MPGLISTRDAQTRAETNRARGKDCTSKLPWNQGLHMKQKLCLKTCLAFCLTEVFTLIYNAILFCLNEVMQKALCCKDQPSIFFLPFKLRWKGLPAAWKFVSLRKRKAKNSLILMLCIKYLWISRGKNQPWPGCWVQIFIMFFPLCWRQGQSVALLLQSVLILVS